VAFDANRLKELDAQVRRMGALASVFAVRCDNIGNKNFAAFRDLMDLYVDMCHRQMKEGVDFLDEGVAPTAEDADRMNATFQRIFGCTPDQFRG